MELIVVHNFVIIGLGVLVVCHFRVISPRSIVNLVLSRETEEANDAALRPGVTPRYICRQTDLGIEIRHPAKAVELVVLRRRCRKKAAVRPRDSLAGQ